MSGESAVGKLARLAFVILGGMLLAWIVTLAILFVQASFNVQTVLEQTNTLLQHTGMLRLVQGVQSVCIFALPPFLYCLINRESPAQRLLFRKPSGEQVALAIFSLIAAIPLINALVTWNESVQLPWFLHGLEEWMRVSENKAEELTKLMMSGTEWYDLFFSLLVVAVLAGFGEELLFRGLLQGVLARFLGKKRQSDKGSLPNWAMHTSIWLIAFLFSAIHLQFFGFIPRMLLGAWFGYLLWWTGSIWVPILAHMTNNALSTFFMFASANKWITDSPDHLGTDKTWWTCLLSVLLLAACAVLIKRKRPL